MEKRILNCFPVSLLLDLVLMKPLKNCLWMLRDNKVATCTLSIRQDLVDLNPWSLLSRATTCKNLYDIGEFCFTFLVIYGNNIGYLLPYPQLWPTGQVNCQLSEICNGRYFAKLRVVIVITWNWRETFM